jgi:hypothetical protein
MRAAPEADSIRDTLQRGIHEVRDLVRLELDLARAEFRQELKSLRTIAMLFGAAAALLAVGGLWVLVAASRGLAALLHWPVWAGYAVVGVPILFMGSLALALALDRARSVRVLPETRDTLRRAASRFGNSSPADGSQRQG